MGETVNSLLRWAGLAEAPQPDPNALYRNIAANPVGTEQVPTVATTADPSYQPPERVGAWNWVQRQRDSAEAEGLWDPNTGLPTIKGLAAGVRHAAEGVMLGTEAPGFRSYHGSPHSFERFDSSRIGTGEGAQAYGHGLYFAESENVAKSYRDALAPGGAPQVKPSAEVTAKYQPQWDDLVAQHRASLKDGWRTTDESNAVMAKMDALHKQMVDETIAADPSLLNPGSMYEVNINAPPEHFLDWDRPLSRQGQGIWRALGDDAGPGKTFTPEMTMQQVMDRLGLREARRAGVSPSSGPELAANYLRDAGIPGIRYLDQGSRAGGEGSRNTVVFDDSIIDILRKYGIAGLMAGGAAAGASQSQ